MSNQVGGKAGGGAQVAITDGSEVQRLTNALRFEKAKNQVLLGEVVALEDAVVNRCMEDFDAVLSDDTREFWREQLLTNREAATTALTELARAKQGQVAGGTGVEVATRRPLHNRAVARPVAPAAVGGGGVTTGTGQTGVSDADGSAAKIRNRAHEISKAERVPFSTAFRRAEREVSGQ